MEITKAATWKNVGGWKILLRAGVEPSCLMTAKYVDGTIVQLGFSAKTHSIQLIMTNTKWKSITGKKGYDVVFSFDNKTIWKGKTSSFRITNKTAGIRALIRDADFFREFARRQTLKASRNDRKIAAISLKGSHTAVRELMHCQVEKGPQAAKSTKLAKALLAKMGPVNEARDVFAD